MGEHDDLPQVALARRGPPVGQQALLRLGRIVGDEQAILASGVAEVALGVAVAQLRERITLGRLVLATVLREPHGPELIAEGRV